MSVFKQLKLYTFCGTHRLGLFSVDSREHSMIERVTAFLLEPKLRHYVRIARPDHWVKHVFIIPGCVAAWVLVDRVEPNLLARVLLGFASACLLSSANYVVNEWLDSEYDTHHPLESESDRGARGPFHVRLACYAGICAARCLGPVAGFHSRQPVLARRDHVCPERNRLQRAAVTHEIVSLSRRDHRIFEQSNSFDPRLGDGVGVYDAATEFGWERIGLAGLF